MHPTVKSDWHALCISSLRHLDGLQSPSLIGAGTEERFRGWNPRNRSGWRNEKSFLHPGRRKPNNPLPTGAVAPACGSRFNRPCLLTPGMDTPLRQSPLSKKLFSSHPRWFSSVGFLFAHSGYTSAARPGISTPRQQWSRRSELGAIASEEMRCDFAGWRF